MPTKRLICSVAILASVLLQQGCSNSIGLELAAIAVAEPFLRRSPGNFCSDSPAEAYVMDYPYCSRTVSPIDSTNVNFRWQSPNGLCFLEWALAYDKADKVEEAIAKGADPFKCNPMGSPFFRALHELESRHGVERRNYYLRRLKETKVLGERAGAKFIRYGLENSDTELIRNGLDLGHPIDAPLRVKYDYGRFKDIFSGKSPIYVASLKFLIHNTPASAATVELLVRRGARIDPGIYAWIASDPGRFKDGAVEKLGALLNPPNNGSPESAGSREASARQ